MLKTTIAVASALILVFGSVLHAGDRPSVTWVYMADLEPANWEENSVAKGMEVDRP